MSRLPQPGSDDDIWGDILNDYLQVQHHAVGSHKLGAILNAPAQSGLVLNADPSRPDGVAWRGLTAADVGLGNVDNTSDANKPLNSATQAALANMVSKSGDTMAGTLIGPFQDKGGQVYNVRAFGALGDGLANDLIAIQGAINTASAAGGGVVYFPSGTYSIGSSITPKSNVILRGCGEPSGLVMTANGKMIYGVTGSFSDFTIEGLTFWGSVNQFPAVPTRGRTTSGPGAQTAIYIDGNRNPNSVGGAMTNFTMRGCIVRNCSALPIRIGGMSGVVRVVDCEFTNNQDVGFLYNQEVIFSNNHVTMSADNGVSLSRGNNKITCTGNTFENCCYNGIWLSGFDVGGLGDLTNVGPTNFSCSGNTVKDVGYNGIICDAAPMHGSITATW